MAGWMVVVNVDGGYKSDRRIRSMATEFIYKYTKTRHAFIDNKILGQTSVQDDMKLVSLRREKMGGTKN